MLLYTVFVSTFLASGQQQQQQPICPLVQTSWPSGFVLGDKLLVNLHLRPLAVTSAHHTLLHQSEVKTLCTFSCRSCHSDVRQLWMNLPAQTETSLTNIIPAVSVTAESHVKVREAHQKDLKLLIRKSLWSVPDRVRTGVLLTQYYVTPKNSLFFFPLQNKNTDVDQIWLKFVIYQVWSVQT